MEEILTAEQVAQILQVHPFTVLKFIKQGKLKASKLGRVYRIRKSDVDSFLDSQVERAEEASRMRKEKREAKKREKAKNATEPEKKRVVGQGTTEPDAGKMPEKIRPEPEEKKIMTEERKEDESPERNEREDIDHYILELKTNHT